MDNFEAHRVQEFNRIAIELGMEGYPVLHLVDYMAADCFLATDSAGKKRYVVGRLDNGNPFCRTPSFL